MLRELDQSVNHGTLSDECDIILGSDIYFDFGVVIGARGLGYKIGTIDKKLYAKEQKFGVTIGSDVFIGANTVVVRGSWRDTVIGDGTKIANNVTVGHNVIIGKNVLIGPGVILCGSCEIGDNCSIWANSVISQHVIVPKDVSINGLRLVLKSDYPEQNP